MFYFDDIKNVCIFDKRKTQNTMKKSTSKLEVGSRLYWIDNPEILAGIVVRFTEKRDVVINFVSGNQLGEFNYPLRIANKFICK